MRLEMSIAFEVVLKRGAATASDTGSADQESLAALCAA